MSNSDRKVQIYKMRLTALIDEHADALAQAQQFHQELQQSNNRIAELEEQLRNNDVQKEEPKVTIIDHDLVSTNNEDKVS